MESVSTMLSSKSLISKLVFLVDEIDINLINFEVFTQKQMPIKFFKLSFCGIVLTTFFLHKVLTKFF